MIIFMDGFDAYQTAQVGNKWDSWTGTGLAIGSPYGRYGSQGIRISDTGAIRKVALPVNRMVIGFAFRVGATMDTDGRILCAFLLNGAFQCELGITIGNQLQLYRNGTAITGGLSSIVLTPGVTYFCDFKCMFSTSTSTGDVVVRIAGVPVITLPAASNVAGAGGTTANSFQLGHGARGLFSTNYQVDFDDCYVLDGAGSVNNDFIGDQRVEVIWPTAAGTDTDFTNVGGANSVVSVTDNPPDNDTSYIKSNTPGQKQTYTFTALASTPASIAGIQIGSLVRKDDAGTRVLAALIKSGGTDYLGASYGLNDSYLLQRTIFEQNPATSAAWTASDITSLEAGVKLVV